MSLDALVSLHDFLCVDGQPFVWVHHDTEEARVCVNETRIVSVLQVMEHRCFIEAGQLGHILHFVEFGRIHLLEVIFSN